jgi:GNAT superfamily N-acetyltransferase
VDDEEMKGSRRDATQVSGARRLATASDVAALTALINEAYLPAEGFLYEGPRISAAEVHDKLAHGRFLLDVGPQGELRGCVHVALSGDVGYFGLLSVSPGAQNQGLGRSLALAAEDLCRADGGRAMTIDVVNHRHELVAFYARLGYAVSGQRPFEDPRLNRPAHFVIMRKRLTEGKAPLP